MSVLLIFWIFTHSIFTVTKHVISPEQWCLLLHQYPIHTYPCVWFCLYYIINLELTYCQTWLDSYRHLYCHYVYGSKGICLSELGVWKLENFGNLSTTLLLILSSSTWYPCYDLVIVFSSTDSVASLCCCRCNSYGFHHYIYKCDAIFILINAEINQQHHRGDMHETIIDLMTI